MKIPVNDDYVRRRMQEDQIEYWRHEIALRRQTDYAVFISYSHQDQAVAQQVTDHFVRAKIRYHIDKKILEWGDTISQEIEKHLQKSTHYLLILSKNSAKSQWCAYEFGIAAAQRKKILVFLTEEDVPVPSFAAPILATADLKKIEEYFAHTLIDPAAVDRFIAEILADQQANLEQFRRIEKPEEGSVAWDSPKHESLLEQAKRFLLYPTDDYTHDTFEQLVRIEFGDVLPREPLVLHYLTDRYGQRRYTLRYNQDLTAVVVEPKKEGCDQVGVRHKTESGEVEFRDETPSVEDYLKLRVVYGWDASQDFWNETLRRLLSRLSAQ